MAQHKPSSIWVTRVGKGDDRPPYQSVRTNTHGTVAIGFFPGLGLDGISHNIPRADARLLAKRILQCLEETK